MSTNRTASDTLTLRAGTPDDAAEVSRIAQLDSAHVPSGDLLLALVNGRPMAALSLATGTVVADPFSPTADLVVMLRARAGDLREADARGRSRRARATFRRRSAGGVPWARFG